MDAMVLVARTAMEEGRGVRIVGDDRRRFFTELAPLARALLALLPTSEQAGRVAHWAAIEGGILGCRRGSAGARLLLEGVLSVFLLFLSQTHCSLSLSISHSSKREPRRQESMSASFCPVAAARSRPAAALASAAPQQRQQQHQQRARALTPTLHHRRRSSIRLVVAEAASSSPSAPKLTNKPAWAGEFLAAIELGNWRKQNRRTRGTEDARFRSR